MTDLVEWMTLAAVAVGTLEYALLIRRRVGERLTRDAEAAGLRGLVRVYHADRPTTGPE
ncbi:MAG TPA: hypothetical protein VES36_01410 [Candidatus Limnocylindrales bacterium]|nr:hypothetical protein [Candidatus Limnocylindrales bacterium]